MRGVGVVHCLNMIDYMDTNILSPRRGDFATRDSGAPSGSYTVSGKGQSQTQCGDVLLDKSSLIPPVSKTKLLYIIRCLIQPISSECGEYCQKHHHQ